MQPQSNNTYQSTPGTIASSGGSKLQAKFQIPGAVHTVLKGHKGCVYQVKYNKNGEYCMSCSQDRSIILWNPEKGTLVKSFSGAHNYEVFDITIAADNSKFGSVGGDKMAFLWDVKKDCVVRKFEGHISRINTVSFNDDESVLVTGSYDATVRFWDLKAHSFKPLEIIKDCKDSVSKIIVNGHEVIVSSIDGKVRTYDLRMGLSTTDDMKSPVLKFSLSSDKKTYAASCQDGAIRLVDREKGQILNTFLGHQISDYSTEVLHSFDDAFIVSGSDDGMVYYYDLLQQKPIKQFKNHSKPVVCLSASPLRNYLVSGSFDMTLTVWKADDSVQI